jgi:YbbR domain-containing protein
VLRRTTLRRRIVVATTEHLPLKAAALFFSIVLWLIVSAEEPTERKLEIPFTPVATDSSVSVGEPSSKVTVLIAGRGRDLWRVYASPPTIKRIVGPDAPATLTFRLTPEDLILPSGVSVVDIQPRTIILHVTVTRVRTVPVVAQFSIVADSGIVITGPPHVTPASVRISGRRDRVAAIETVHTERRVFLVRGDAAILVPLDTGGLGVSVTPASVQVQVPVRRDTSSSGVDRGGALRTGVAAPTARPSERRVP